MHIEGRRWFQTSNGNTYHSVRIFDGGFCIAFIKYEYGYGNQYLDTAIKWLRANNRMPTDGTRGTGHLHEMRVSDSVIDVARKRDL